MSIAGARVTRSLRPLCLPLLLALAACASAPPPKAPVPTTAQPPARPHVARALAALAPASASMVSGKLLLVPQGTGVRITGTVGGLPRSARFGFHVLERGDCSAVDASSAGPHFNPAGAPHGNAKIGAHHAGDLDNLASDLAGVANVDAWLDGVALGGGGPGDILGRALAVDARPDDYATQPDGRSGPHVACGVIRPAP